MALQAGWGSEPKTCRSEGNMDMAFLILSQTTYTSRIVELREPAFHVSRLEVSRDIQLSLMHKWQSRVLIGPLTPENTVRGSASFD